MAFDDLLLPDATVLSGVYIPWVLGTGFRYPLTVTDTDDSVMSFASGYTALLKLNLSDGTDVLSFTNTLTSGRIVDLNPTTVPGASLVIRSTAAGMASLRPWVKRNLVFNLMVTRTSDGLAVDLMRQCYITPRPDFD